MSTQPPGLTTDSPDSPADDPVREPLPTEALPIAPAGPRPEEPRAAVERLRAAARSRAAHPRAVRVRQLKGLKRMLTEHADRFVAALGTDLGKPATEALITEIVSVRSEVDHALLHLTDWMEPRPVKLPLALRPASAEVRPRPKGLVLVIGAWNYPVQLALAPVVGALAAGNTVVLSPSEKAPATAAALRELVPQYLDSALVSVVAGGKECNTALLAEPWDHILYTGGERVGRIVYEAAAKTLSPVTLELGGKSPAVVTPSRNTGAMARRIAWAKFTNAGQTCVAPDYVLAVGEAALRQVTAEIPAALREFYLALGNCGDLMETDHYVWDPEDLEVRDGFLMFLEDADETVVWGLPVDNLALPDPLVWRRSAGADAPEGEWQDEGGTFSEFLTDLLAWTFEDPEDDEGPDR